MQLTWKMTGEKILGFSNSKQRAFQVHISKKQVLPFHSPQLNSSHLDLEIITLSGLL